MTRVGVLVPLGSQTQLVVERLRDGNALRKARIHPIKVLAALTTYKAGMNFRDKINHTWEPVQAVIDALNDAFYLSFAEVEPTGKRYLIAIDVSGSMHGTRVNGVSNLTCHEGAGAMAMVIARSESSYALLGYDTKVHPLTLSPSQRLDDVVQSLRQVGRGGTDCAVPIKWALEHKTQVDTFLSFSDSESWAGKQHVSQAIAEYRKRINSEARVINIQMTATQFTNNNPGDGLSLEVCGFDTSVPQIISSFARGEM